MADLSAAARTKATVAVRTPDLGHHRRSSRNRRLSGDVLGSWSRVRHQGHRGLRGGPVVEQADEALVGRQFSVDVQRAGAARLIR